MPAAVFGPSEASVSCARAPSGRHSLLRHPAASGAWVRMVLLCSVCRRRARADGSCKNGECSLFVAPRRGKGGHWKVKRLQAALGNSDVGACFGDFIAGGFAGALEYRHDVRVGMASGMVLRERVADVALRIELLCLPFLCYWKWGADSILRRVLSDLPSVRAADADGRATLYERFWEQAEREVRSQDVAVVGARGARTVKLYEKAKVRSLGGNAAGVFSYSLMMNPAGRRLGSHEFGILMEDLRSGRLEKATRRLADVFAASGASYAVCEEPLFGVHLWNGARYSRVRFLRWLFKAEGVAVKPSKADWEVLTGMGSGSEKGARAAGDLTYEGAVAACRIVSEDIWGKEGPAYGLDDLVCLLCLSQHKEAVAGGELPALPRSVTVAGDLGEVCPCAPPPEQASRHRLSQKTSDRSWAASGAASSGGRPCPRRPRWGAWVFHRQGKPSIFSQLPPVTLLDLLSLPDQARLCHTSTFLLHALLCHVRRWGWDCWMRVREDAHKMVIEGPGWHALTASGVRDGDNMRIRGLVCDMVGSLMKQPLPAEVPLVALGIARCAIKFQLNSDQQESLAEDFSAGGCFHLPRVGLLEHWLMMNC